MLYNHDDILSINQSKKVININYDIINRLAANIKNNIHLGNNVQEITHMPLTNNYILKINDIFINADKVILTTNMNIKMTIPRIIYSQFAKIKSYNQLHILFKTSNINYIASNDDKLYQAIILNNRSSINLLQKYLNDSKISEYRYINWKNAYHISKQELTTDFYKEYNMILAVHPYLNSLEGSCISAIKAVDIIMDNIYSKRSEFLYKY
jgi:hypothetical protein